MVPLVDLTGKFILYSIGKNTYKVVRFYGSFFKKKLLQTTKSIL